MTRWRRNRRATARPAEPAGRRANGRGRSTTPRVVVEKVIDGRTPKARHPCRTVVRSTDRIGVVLPGPLPLRRAAARAPGALARRRTRLPGLVALGLLHRRHRRTPRRAPGTRAPGRGVELPSLGRLPRRHARERRLRRPPLRSPGNRRCASRAHSRQRGAPGGRPPHRPRLVGARDAARRRVLRVHLPAPDIGSHVGRKSGLTRSGVPPPGRGPSTW